MPHAEDVSSDVEMALLDAENGFSSHTPRYVKSQFQFQPSPDAELKILEMDFRT